MDDCSVDPLYMENLSEWLLEEGRVVTYKFLARSLKLHVNVAKQMLFNFRAENKAEVTTVYLVSGVVKTGEGVPPHTKVSLVKEDELEAIEKEMSTVHSKHIYSLQKAESPVTFTALYATDVEVFKEDPINCGSSFSSIKNRAAVPKEDTRPKVSIPSKEEKKTEIVKKENVKKEIPKKSALEEAFSKSKKPSPVKNEVKKDDGVKNSSAGKVKKPQQGQLANMFAKQASKPKVEKVKDEEKIEEKENIANEKIEDEASVKEEVKQERLNDKPILSELNSKKSPSKSKSPVKPVKKTNKKEDDSKKRKRIQVLSDSEESGGEEDVEEKPAVLEEEETGPPATALIESDDEEIVPATPKAEPSARPGRRRVKKLVNKTYVDDEGFMVTKKVYESGSETDEEPPAPEEKPVKKSPVKVEAPAAKKPKLGAPGGKAQPGIMNFFKKK